MRTITITMWALSFVITLFLYGTISTKPSPANFSQKNVRSINFPPIDAKECSNIAFTFKVWVEKNFDKEKYTELAKPFFNLVTLCQKSDSDPSYKKRIAEALGTPFDTVAKKYFDRDDIHVNLTINIEDESIFFEVVISRDEIHNEEEWTTIVFDLIDFIKADEWIQTLSPLFTNIINVSNDVGIHGSLNIALEPNKS